MKITLLCKTCHETEFKLISQVGIVKFQCLHCGEIQNQLKIGKNEIYKNKCTHCHGERFKIRINKEINSANIECKKCGEAPDKIFNNEESNVVIRQEYLKNEEVALTKIDENEEEEIKKSTSTSYDKELKEIASSIWELKNDLIRLTNRVDEIERKTRVEKERVRLRNEARNNGEGILGKFMSKK